MRSGIPAAHWLDNPRELLTALDLLNDDKEGDPP